MAELTPPPILHPIAEPPSGLTPRVWARYFVALASQAGTEGPAGPQGEQGEPGPPGPAGPAGADATLGPTLTTIEALTGLADRMIYFTGTDVAALAVLTAVARTLLAAATQADQRTALGLGTAALTSYEESTFTVTATGFTTTVSGTVNSVRVGKKVTVTLPFLTGTSNATTMTLTGWPAPLVPTGPDDLRFVLNVQDNVGTNPGVLGLLIITTAGVFNVFTSPNGAAWTASGTKRLFRTSLSYLLP